MYRDLSVYYDEVFAVDAAEMRFVRDLLRGRRRVLDAGCGTGNKTVLLEEAGRSIAGVDADATMIERARRGNSRPGIAYEVLDISALAGRFGPGSFDAAVCLGNTLVHLTRPGAIRDLCGAVRGLLAPGGLFVCQILNYDHILDKAVTWLPVIDTPRARFSRFYDPEGPNLAFRTELYLKDTGETLRNSIPLYPLRPGEFAAMLRDAGFSGQDAYGSYDGGPFTENSFIFIVAAVA